MAIPYWKSCSLEKRKGQQMILLQWELTLTYWPKRFRAVHPFGKHDIALLCSSALTHATYHDTSEKKQWASNLNFTQWLLSLIISNLFLQWTYTTMFCSCTLAQKDKPTGQQTVIFIKIYVHEIVDKICKQLVKIAAWTLIISNISIPKVQLKSHSWLACSSIFLTVYTFWH